MDFWCCATEGFAFRGAHKTPTPPSQIVVLSVSQASTVYKSHLFAQQPLAMSVAEHKCTVFDLD